MADRLPAILLAAGFSRRMGQCKLLLPFRGRALIEHVLCALEAAGRFAPMLAVLGPHSPPDLATLLRHKPGLELLEAPESALGQAESLKAGWRHLKGRGDFSGALVLLGDQPLLRPALLLALHDAFAAAPGCIAPQCRGRRGNPVMLSAEALDALLQSPERESPRLALAAFPWHLLEWADSACLRDVDTPEAYAALTRDGESSNEGDHDPTISGFFA